MSGEAAAIVGALFGFVGTCLLVLAYSLVKTREKVVRLEAKINGQGLTASSPVRETGGGR